MGSCSSIIELRGWLSMCSSFPDGKSDAVLRMQTPSSKRETFKVMDLRQEEEEEEERSNHSTMDHAQQREI